jgi:hypothetical protein
MADISELLDEMKELREAIGLWNIGMNNVVDSLKAHSEMLKDILEAVSYEPEDEDSPLATLLKALVGRADLHTEVLTEIAEGISELRGKAKAA